MDQIKIGAFLKELRNDNNLTQEQLAEKFGVSQRSVSRWEKCEPFVGCIVLYLNHFGSGCIIKRK